MIFVSGLAGACAGRVSIVPTTGYAHYQRLEQAPEAYESARLDAVSNALTFLAQKHGRLEGAKVKLTLLKKEMEGKALVDGIDVVKYVTSQETTGGYRVELRAKVKIINKAHEIFIKQYLQELIRGTNMPTGPPVVALWLKHIKSRGGISADVAEGITGSVYVSLGNTRAKRQGLIRVIERSQVEHTVEEMQLQKTGATIKVAELGRTLGAHIIIVGTVEKLLGKYVVSLQLVYVESGETLSIRHEGTYAESKLPKVAARVIDKVVEDYVSQSLEPN